MTILDDGSLAYSMAGFNRRKNPYDTRRALAQQMMAQGTDTSPIQSPWQGVARLAQAMAGAYGSYKADVDEKADETKRNETLGAELAKLDPNGNLTGIAKLDPSLALKIAGQGLVEKQKIAAQGQQRGQQATDWAGGYGAPQGGQIQQGPLPPPGADPAATAISGIESAGGPNGGYGAVGPVANKQGNRAYGKYQVLDTNIGPWTQEVLGKPMSPQEFLANPQAQDAVFKAKFGQYRQQFGSDEAASRAWFAGPGGMNNPSARDVNGMTVQGYSQKFQAGMPPPSGAQPQPGQAPPAPPVMVQATPPQGNAQQPGAPLTVNMRGPGGVPQGSADGAMPPMQGAPPPPQAPGGMPAVTAQPPAIPDVPRPPPNPQTVARLKQAIARGLPEAQADAILNQEIDREWSVARERAKMEYDQQSQAYTEGRKPTEAQKAVDTNFGKDYAEWVAGGGFADTQRQIAQLDEVVGKLKTKRGMFEQNLTGAGVGMTPDWLLNVVNPEAVSARNAVEEVAQRNLRLVLGAQFTEKEGERLIARAYNPSLSEAENAKRVERLLSQIKQAAAAKVSAGQYYEQHGTLRGWSGKLPTIADFDPDVRLDRGSSEDLKKKYRLE